MLTSVGQLLVNEALPPPYRDYSRRLDARTVRELLERIAREDPENYPKVIDRLHRIGQEVVTHEAPTISLDDLLAAADRVQALRRKFRYTLRRLVGASHLSRRERARRIAEAAQETRNEIDKALEKVPDRLASMVLSGARVKTSDLRGLVAGDFQVEYPGGEELPITSSYLEGLDPSEYWISLYGARKGLVSTKLDTAEAGALGKYLQQAAHRLVVTSRDCGTSRGIRVKLHDPDNLGAVLAEDVGEVKAGTVLTPEVLKRISRKAVGKIRSPLTCEAERGICATCAGEREHGRLSEIGENIGITAALSLGERLSQTMLKSKHVGGRPGISMEGLDPFRQLIQLEKGPLWAVVAENPGTVRLHREGKKQVLYVGNRRYPLPEGLRLKVKEGTRVDPGDILTEGIPHPAILAEQVGLGRARRIMTDVLTDLFRRNRLDISRRNVEAVVRGLYSYVQLKEAEKPRYGLLPGDVVDLSVVERRWRPRPGSQVARLQQARGKYLEQPIDEYTVGTPMTPAVIRDLEKRGLKHVVVHSDPPPFAPFVRRGSDMLLFSPDWQVRLGGSRLKAGLQEAVERSRTSAYHSESYIPALARGTDFGRQLYQKGVY